MMTVHLCLVALSSLITYAHGQSVYAYVYQVSERSLWNYETNQYKVKWAGQNNMNAEQKCPLFKQKSIITLEQTVCKQLPGNTDCSTCYYKADPNSCKGDTATDGKIIEYSDSSCSTATGTSWSTLASNEMSARCGVGAISWKPGLYLDARCSSQSVGKWANGITLTGFTTEGGDPNGRYTFRGDSRNLPGSGQKTWFKDDGWFIYYCVQFDRYCVSAGANWDNIVADQSQPRVCPASVRAPKSTEITTSVYNSNSNPLITKLAESERWIEYGGSAGSWPLARETAGVGEIFFQPIDFRDPNTVTLGSFSKNDAYNGAYLQANPEFDLNGKPTFWDDKSNAFLYYCGTYNGKAHQRWYGVAKKRFCDIKDGGCMGGVRSAQGVVDILHPAFQARWEAFTTEWAWPDTRGNAGITALTKTLKDDLPSRAEPQGVDPSCKPVETGKSLFQSPTWSLIGFTLVSMLCYSTKQ